jgi:hypothetical protein
MFFLALHPLILLSSQYDLAVGRVHNRPPKEFHGVISVMYF